jgi:hypothetical protein
LVPAATENVVGLRCLQVCAASRGSAEVFGGLRWGKGEMLVAAPGPLGLVRFCAPAMVSLPQFCVSRTSLPHVHAKGRERAPQAPKRHLSERRPRHSLHWQAVRRAGRRALRSQLAIEVLPRRQFRHFRSSAHQIKCARFVAETGHARQSDLRAPSRRGNVSCGGTDMRLRADMCCCH